MDGFSKIELISEFISAGRARLFEDQMFQRPSSHAFLLAKPFDDDDLAHIPGMQNPNAG